MFSQNGVDAADYVGFLKFCTEAANASYEGILRPGTLIEQLISHSKGKAKTLSHDFEIPGCAGYKMLRCVHAHHDCVKQHRKFFNNYKSCEAKGDEVRQFVADTLKKHEQKVVAPLLKKHAKELMDKHREWKAKLDDLKQQAHIVAPIKKRLANVIQPLPVEAMCDFDEDEILEMVRALKDGEEGHGHLDIDAGEKLIVLDNSNKLYWRVRKRNGDEGDVPSLFLAVPPPDPQLNKKVTRMEDEFATSVIKTTNFLKKADRNNSLETMQILRMTTAQMNGTVVIHPVKDMEAMLDATNFKPTLNNSIKSLYSISTLSLASSVGRRREKKMFEFKTRLVDEMVEEAIECYAPEISEFEGQEVKMFIIAGVTDPRDFKLISFDQATQEGILDMQEGLYINPETGDTMTIQDAMCEGLINVEKSVTRNKQEKEYKKRARSYEQLL